MKQKLVILTTHFGTNFSGGSTATCEIFSRLENEFSEIVVIGTQIGDHPFNSVEFLRYKNWYHAIKILKSLKNDSTIFYGDFYNSFLFILASVRFHFTYHDNWPELGQTSLMNRVKSFFYVTVYNRIFKKADHLFSVTASKMSYMKSFSCNISLIRNGFSRVKNISDSNKGSVLMVGNIDKRKYEKALLLFKRLRKMSVSIEIDIYGKVNDQNLADKISQFAFVSIKGFHNIVPYHQYQFLLHTSVMENLPIVFCEAIYHQIPVLTFDVGGISEVVNEANGKLIRPFDIDFMAEELMKNISNWKIDSEYKLSKEYSWEYASSSYLKHLIEV